MGEHPVNAFVERMEWAGRTGQESVCARPQHVGLELGIWRWRRRVLLRRRHWLGDRRLGDVAEHPGATVVEPANLPSIAKIGDAELEVLLYELKSDLNAYLASLGPTAPVKTLADVIRFNEQNAPREMPYFGQELFEQAQKKGPLTDAKYKAARAKCIRLARTEGIDAVMTKHRLDALVAPTQGPVWLLALVNGVGGGGGRF